MAVLCPTTLWATLNWVQAYMMLCRATSSSSVLSVVVEAMKPINANGMHLLIPHKSNHNTHWMQLDHVCKVNESQPQIQPIFFDVQTGWPPCYRYAGKHISNEPVTFQEILLNVYNSCIK